MGGDLLVSGVVQATPDKLRSSCSVMKYHKEGTTCGISEGGIRLREDPLRAWIPYDATSSEADCEYSL